MRSVILVLEVLSAKLHEKIPNIFITPQKTKTKQLHSSALQGKYEAFEVFFMSYEYVQCSATEGRQTTSLYVE